jgi:hypothetical protein
VATERPDPVAWYQGGHLDTAPAPDRAATGIGKGELHQTHWAERPGTLITLRSAGHALSVLLMPDQIWLIPKGQL